MKPAAVLAALAVALGWPSATAAAQTEPTPTAATDADAGDAAAVDWNDAVTRACTQRRYAMRLAAARRVGEGGDAAVPAVRAFAAAHGHAAVTVPLVEAIAEHGGDGPQLLQLLADWAGDREFYWRAQALRGLALRARASAELAVRWQPLFAAGIEDRAWLVRAFAWFGSGRLDLPPALDPDPRARTRIAALLGDEPKLLEALGDERTFLGDPWGRRRAGEAIAALRQRLGTDCGYRTDAAFDDNRAAMAELAQLVSRRACNAQPTDDPSPHYEDAAPPRTAGLEVLSCRNGDLFVHWTADGRIGIGPTPAATTTIEPPAAAWQRLSTDAAALDLPAQSGVVICDRMRLWLDPTAAQAAVAPGAAPPALLDWLKRLAAVIEEAGEPHLADALRDRTAQFAPPSEHR